MSASHSSGPDRGAPQRALATATGAEQERLPLVSVIVAVYNGAGTVGDCIESLLSQDYPKDRYEVIVVDNDSSDGTAEIIKRYPVRYVWEGCLRCPGGARNAGCRQAKGELFAFSDADQVADRGWLSSLVRALPQGYAGIAGTNVPLGDRGGVVARFAREEATFRPAEHEADIVEATGGNVLYRRDAFECVGGFQDVTMSLEDYDLSLRITQDHGMRIRYTPRAIQYHRFRTTLAGLLKHEARFGYAAEWIGEQRGERPTSICRLLVRTTFSLLKSCGAALWTLVQVPVRPRMVEKLLTVCVWMMLSVMNAWGRVAYRTGRKLPRNW